ncbi:ATP-binding cassette domain-containing protein [Flavobacterium agricola]|uniref:ATP-binding cassette domain-containing protein n=1 Tax=Flavobacterium agricola TaxID=2870839 RepID=A0ABY6LY12_9FLAO|nr:ATP-binding cassette domain-containing protein [Flavobacterium agricola]UYW00300.1 ATP-binding cassette domain-containing protein [Flavobacterium agricola]
MNDILEVKNVVKRYGKYTALNNVSLTIPSGCIYGLLGPNGAGKTSLIRIINQITYPDQGQVLFNGKPLAPHHVGEIGYMPEERGLYKSMKVGEQALYLAQLKGMDRNEAKKQLKYWFEKLNIESWWDKKLQELSKGMAQKVQFIVTVLHQPKLLILDEPFSGFDPVNANLIKDEILELNKKGTTIIFSTHRMESVEEMCDYIALIDKSNKIIEGKLIDVKKQYRNNSYQVGIIPNDVEKLMYELTLKYKVEQADFKSLNNELKLNVHLGNDVPNQVLPILLQNGVVTHFTENIPSINDIFISSVQGATPNQF